MKMAENDSFDTEISSAVSNHNGLCDDRARNCRKNTEMTADQEDHQTVDVDNTQNVSLSFICLRTEAKLKILLADNSQSFNNP